jgi:hypothetical protein
MAEGVDLDKDGGGSGSLQESKEKPMSYADRLKTNIKYDQRLKRNVLEIEIEKLDKDNEIVIDQSCVARLLTSLGMNIQTQLKGYQAVYGRVVTLSVWCQPGVDLERFCRAETIQVTRGVWTRNIRPAGRRDVVVTVSGLEFNTPDTLVQGYIEKFGGKLVTKDAIYGKHGEGPLMGFFNGERKYNVEFNDSAKPMGTYHFLDGARVRVFYRGNVKTCARCHEASVSCMGGGFAKDCQTNGGKKLDLADHMRTIWQEIGFSPTSFQLPVETEIGVDKSNEGDTTISEDKSFRRQIERPELKDDDIKKIVGIQIRNLPPTLSDDEIVTFLVDNVDKDVTLEKLSLVKNEHNLNVAIENGLEGSQVIAAAAKLEFRQSKQKFFGKPLYCRLLKNLTPEKAPVKNLSKEINPVPKLQNNPKLSVKEKTKALEDKAEDKKTKSKSNTILECGLTNTTAQQMKRNHRDVGSPTSPETKNSPKKPKAVDKKVKP